MKALSAAFRRPTALAVVKCKGHSKEGSAEAQGNDAADQAAKRAAGYIAPQGEFQLTQAHSQGQWTEDQVRQEQEQASPEERSVWLARGLIKDQVGIFRTPDTIKPEAPSGLLSRMMAEAHGLSHRPSGDIEQVLSGWWHPFMTASIRTFCRTCQVCNMYGVAPTIKPTSLSRPVPQGPGQQICVDYTVMQTAVNGIRYLLVCTDLF